MRDSRVLDMARVLVDYSTRIKKGDRVLISAAGFEAAPLVKEVYALCLQRGADYVEYSFQDQEIDRQFFNNASKRQLACFPQHKLDFYKTLTAYIGISAGQNSMVYANADMRAASWASRSAATCWYRIAMFGVLCPIRAWSSASVAPNCAANVALV